MDAIDLRLWGSSLLVAIALGGIAWLVLHVLRGTSSLGVRLAAGTALLAAMLASGPAVVALARIGLPADTYVVPGLVWQWTPAVLIAGGLAMVLARSRRFRRA